MIGKRFHLEYIRGLKGAISLLRDPTDTDSVFDIVEGFQHTKAYQHALEYVKSVPENRRMFDERYFGGPLHLAEIGQNPPGSLGRELADTMTRLGLDPDFFPKIEARDDITYMMLRLRQTHDVWHLVAGFGTDVAGELGLQAFGLAQLHNPLSVALIAGGLLRTLANAEELDQIMSEAGRGWRLGREAKPFFAQRWDEGWDRPLATWRRELGVAA